MRDVSRRQFVFENAAQKLRLPSMAVFAFWHRLSLVKQFTIVAAIVVGITMAVLGRWVSSRIENSVIRNTASSAALYMDRFVEPYVQELASGKTLSLKSKAALSEIIKTTGFSQHVIKIKIWRPDGTIVYSNNDKLIGKQLPISESLAKALDGMVAPEFNDLSDDENVAERLLRKPLLEIYAPIREANGTKIIAVAEFYQMAEDLAEELAWVRMEGGLMVGGLSLLMLGALISIVGRGSHTIVTQQHALNSRIAQLSESLALNRDLRQRVADANRRASESNESFLRRVSAELHDGPVQLIGLALLRLDGIRPLAERADGDRASETLEIIRGALKDALSEIRGLSHGLALPELENLSLLEALDLAITNHERRSGTAVAADFTDAVPDVPASIKTCAYRFVQEGLNNAFRHADGVGQRVNVSWEGDKLVIIVSDTGPGFAENAQISQRGGLGLIGLRDRIEALGGTMVIDASKGQGTQLQASFSLNDNSGL